MRIVNEITEETLNNIAIFLTKEELLVLQGYIRQLLEDPICAHIHFMDDEYKREIMIASYSQCGDNAFSETVNELLKSE